jgi:hypothetical protein
VARRKCAKRKGRAPRADVAWEWQSLENGRIFSDAPANCTILQREEPQASVSFKLRIFDRRVKCEGEACDSYCTKRTGVAAYLIAKSES